jgi:hypothetical protein
MGYIIYQIKKIKILKFSGVIHLFLRLKNMLL